MTPSSRYTYCTRAHCHLALHEHAISAATRSRRTAASESCAGQTVWVTATEPRMTFWRLHETRFRTIPRYARRVPETLSQDAMIHAGLLGLDAARGRHRGTEGLRSTIVPLSEALYWAAVLDDAMRSEEYERERVSQSVGQVLPGLRYARNFHTHELVASIELRGGLTVPFTVPFSIRTQVVWRRLKDLPEPARASKFTPAHQNGYAKFLAGELPAETLEKASRWFHLWRESLKRQSPGG